MWSAAVWSSNVRSVPDIVILTTCIKIYTVIWEYLHYGKLSHPVLIKSGIKIATVKVPYTVSSVKSTVSQQYRLQ